MTKSLRLLYAAGPGNVIGTYNYWIQGEDDPSQVSMTYSGQFYETCRTLNAQAYIISSHATRKSLRDGQFIIEHRPHPSQQKSGILYHIGMLWYGLQIVALAVCFRANVAIVANGTTHWFVLSLLAWLGIRVVPSLHCLLWRKYQPKSRVEKWILELSRYLFSNSCTAILSASDTISEQVVKLTDNQHQPIVHFLPTYSRAEFVEIDEPDRQRSPFRVLFAGRIEANKGVFDLLEVAKQIKSQDRKMAFDVCGSGSMLETLRLAVEESEVDSFVCHGHCNKAQMREMLSRSHVLIVPTRTEFAEGFNQVVAEGILSGRPVVTSTVCPSLSYVRDAVIEVSPNDIQEYANALLKLYESREFYEDKRKSCLMLQEQFYDQLNSWGTALKSVLLQTQNKEDSNISI